MEVKVGDTVLLKDDVFEYLVLEVNGDRLLIELPMPGFNIYPEYVVLLSDVECVV